MPATACRQGERGSAREATELLVAVVVCGRDRSDGSHRDERLEN
ncbi:hypothetical protein [Natrinema salaciae]|nr:hypothetical protein [Natrinema salaciae]